MLTCAHAKVACIYVHVHVRDMAASSSDAMSGGHLDDNKKDDDRKKADPKKDDDRKKDDDPFWTPNVYNMFFHPEKYIRPVHSSDEENDDKKKDDDKTKDDPPKDDDMTKDDDLKKDDDKKKDDDVKKDDDRKKDELDIEGLFKGKKRLSPEQAAQAARRAAQIWVARRYA